MRQHDDQISRAAKYFEAMRGTWNLQFEIAKHTSATSGVLLLVLGAFVGMFYPELLLPQVAYVSAALLSIAAIGSIVVMNQVSYIILHHIAEDVSVLESAFRQAEESPPEEDEQALKLAAGLERRTKWFTRVSRATIVALVTGAVCFLGFALYNLTGGVWP
jgi:hypothetical protein